MSGGKSQSIVFLTADEKFIIKTISKAEKSLFLNILLKSYSERIINESKSKLVRIIGVFKLMPTHEYFIIMENIIPCSSNAIIFDLKGSSIGRYVEISDPIFPIPGKVLKDDNFKNFAKRVVLDPESCCDIIKTLEDDMGILMNHNIMDYSLLLAFYEDGHGIDICNLRHTIDNNGRLYAIGIIDIFQAYNNLKISERAIKKVLVRGPLRLSVQPADSYFSRLVSFLRIIFISKDL